MMNLDHLQLELKQHCIEHLDQALEAIENVLATDSDAYNTFILLRAQEKKLSSDLIKGILSHDQQILRTNQLRFSIINFIDDLQLEDLKAYQGKTPSPKQNQEPERKKGSINKFQINLTRATLKQLNYTPLQVKTALAELGILDKNIPLTNEIDEVLIHAVMQFQQQEQLAADGIYGKMTHAKLLSKQK